MLDLLKGHIEQHCPDVTGGGRSYRRLMVAREVDRAACELRVFRSDAWHHFVLAAVAFALALAASVLLPSFAVPLLLGGMAALALGGRAYARRWELIDRLVLDPGCITCASGADNIGARIVMLISDRVY